MVVDRLLADLPIETVSKLEVYTFGSAASHFNNPRLTLHPKASPPGNDVNFSNPPSDNVIPHVEHYCNERDMVPRWGVMYSVEKILQRRYSGKVFVRKEASGHMFNQHYMDPMFPLGGDGVGEEDGGKLEGKGFLAEVVDVDEGTAVSREGAAREVARRGRLVEEGAETVEEVPDGSEAVKFGNGERMPVRLIVGGEGGREEEGAISFVEEGMPGVVGARGKTVRELSRLWR